MSEPQSLSHYITYSVITSQPALSYTSVVSTVRCHAVTSGEMEGSTLVEWTGNFSNDADAGECLPLDPFELLLNYLTGVIQDAKFKRREALADLAKAAKKM